MIGLSGSIQFFAGRALNSIPEGILIALFAWIILRLVGRQNSGTRFAVWFVALLAIALIPFIPIARVGGTVGRVVRAEVVLPGAWAIVIFVLWTSVAVIATVRIVIGLLKVRSLRNTASPLAADALAPELRETLDQCRAIRPVELRVSSRVRVPAAIGFFHPVILLPEWAIETLTPEELRTVVLHEFAHLRRRDDWTNLAQKLVRAVFFFHPAVLWIEKRLSLEREMACDDAVLAETQNPHAYARCLVSLAERSFLRRGVALAQAAISHAHETSLRVAQILDMDRPRATRLFKPAMAAVMAVVAIAFAALPSAPRLVAFQDRSAVAAGTAEMSSGGEYPQVARSMVVPVMAQLHPPQQQSPDLVARNKSHLVKAARARELLAKSTASQHRPMAVEAGLRQNPQEVLVITETTDYFQHGSQIVGVLVWRVTLVKATVKPATQVERPNQT